ncbi:CrcB-like protein-domain-containing protein [Durotheca rogersii]|uniref:CrcB-like protein-domain-containing protein n=1 Tax=Durotheca rogersii TaxID=419775 RepID=UPI002220AA16|nr:CrcB-like protein-domain-containing protein [Durotheca rogersii]KAI5860615.1 CrcB-like protein-domain-containing protein [Durotheca rogersii]
MAANRRSPPVVAHHQPAPGETTRLAMPSTGAVSQHRPSRSRSDHEREHDASPRPSSVEYDAPRSYENLHDLDVGGEISRPDRSGSSNPEGSQLRQRTTQRPRSQRADYDIPDSYVNVPELENIAPIPSRDERDLRPSPSLEEGRALERAYSVRREAQPRGSTSRHAQAEPEEDDEGETGAHKVSRLATEIYTVSYLILFAIFGTLARLGLQALTYYAGAPVSFSSVWPNFAGSLVLGFLAEDRMLFRFEWGDPAYEKQLLKVQGNGAGAGAGAENADEEAVVDLAAAKKAHMATKKTIPLYIGLATGFCGSFTSFSSFMRDLFLALSNDLVAPDTGPVTTPRNGGYSFMAALAVLITTVSLSLAGLTVGAQLALALEPVTPSLPFALTRRFLDPLAVLLGWGSWVGAALLSALPPDRFSTAGLEEEIWRGRATLALAFAPLGCLARFYASLHLNGRLAPSFPLGTFAVNVAGTAVLGAAWDLAHLPTGGVIGCQVLQGVQDGFCGCLTTVSTWVAELTALRRKHAYVYGAASIAAGLACLVAIMGGLRWSRGFSELACLH